MSNPSKQKGTDGETELKDKLAELGLRFVRTPAGYPFDLTNANPYRLELDPLEVLATRPDRGHWLMTMSLEHFAELLSGQPTAETHEDEPYAGAGKWETHIEVKRYKRFALHSLFEEEF